jgi:hypothetical protein
VFDVLQGALYIAMSTLPVNAHRLATVAMRVCAGDIFRAGFAAGEASEACEDACAAYLREMLTDPMRSPTEEAVALRNFLRGRWNG